MLTCGWMPTSREIIDPIANKFKFSSYPPIGRKHVTEEATITNIHRKENIKNCKYS